MASQFWKTLVGKLTQTANVARFKAIDLSASKLKLTSALTKRLESSAELTSKLALILNDITGYTQCQLLKEQVDLKSKQYSENRKLIAEAKEEYEAAVKERSSAQRELSSLLQRKQLWTDDEVERFTVLYRSEIKLEQNESFCREKYNKMEKEQEATHNALMDAIRERYQEEQLWSDKIRRASTIGTFSLMTLNIFVFIILQIWIEPRKRKRLVADFQEKAEAQRIKEAEAVMSKLQELEAQIASSSKVEKVEEKTRLTPIVLTSAAAALIVSLLAH